MNQVIRILFASSLLLSFTLNAQISFNKGSPYLQNYKPSDYNWNGKIWDIKSASNGLVYFASDKALIEFDGENWRFYRGSAGIIRSLHVSNDSTIYTGSDLDFGVFHKEGNTFRYQSLYPFKQEVQDLYEEFWNVYEINGSTIFVSSKNLYIYRNGQLTKISAPHSFTSNFVIDGELYLTDEISGLYIFSGFSIQQLVEYNNQSAIEFIGGFKSESDTFLVSRNDGLFKVVNKKLIYVNSDFSQWLKRAKAFTFEVVEDEYLAIGTILEGIYLTDKKGKILHWINKHKGLYHNTVLSLHYSPLGQLWLGLDYGISCIFLSDNLRLIHDYTGNFGTPSSALLVEGELLLGTNQGLYTIPWIDLANDKTFDHIKLIKGSEGQVWSLKRIDDIIFVCHDKGLFEYKNGLLSRIENHEGVLSLTRFKSHLLAGNYNGISIFRKENNKWKFWKKMSLILGTCLQLEADQSDILWVNIPNYGIIRIKISDDFEPLERNIFLQDSFDGENIDLSRNMKGSIQVKTKLYKYTYNTELGNFEKVPYIKKFQFPFETMPGIHEPPSLSSEYEYIPVHNGLALYALNSNPKYYPLISPLIRNFKAFNNLQTLDIVANDDIPYGLNHIKIDYIVPNRKGVLYQYKLQNNGDWSEWSPKTHLEIVNMPPGNHIILIRAKKGEDITESTMVSFKILLPWYRSPLALLIYLTLFGLLIYALHHWQSSKLKRQRKKMLKKEQESLRKQAEKHRQKIKEIEQAALRNELEQLKLQLKHKTVELAAKAKENEDKKRLLLTLKEKMNDAQSNPNKSKIRWGEIHSLLEAYLNVDDMTFEIQIDELHQEFFRKLKEQFPDLSTQDLRLCAYLKIGLNSKEIADLMHVKPSSAYISRSRLRKKLNLSAEDDLYGFLNKF